MIGIDLPLILGNGSFQRALLDGARVTVGTSAQQIFGDLYVGFSLAPALAQIFDSAGRGRGRAAAVASRPLQITLAYRTGFDFEDHTMALLIQYNTTVALKSLIGGFFTSD